MVMPSPPSCGVAPPHLPALVRRITRWRDGLAQQVAELTVQLEDADHLLDQLIEYLPQPETPGDQPRASVVLLVPA
jgi:hypothetical protein